MIIRNEEPGDAATIRTIVRAAFKDVKHSSQMEAAIIDALREAGAMTLSLVACDGDEPIGHVAFSPVTINGKDLDWYGLGPVSVRPDRQGEGIGHALIREGLERLKANGAEGCVVLGEPDYYSRFGFEANPVLQLAEVPPAYFQIQSFSSNVPASTVEYHTLFY